MATRRYRLARRRKAVGLSQEQLATRLKIERTTVVRWESGATEPQPWIRPWLAEALQVSIDQLAELLTPTDDPKTVKSAPSPIPSEISWNMELPGSSGSNGAVTPTVGRDKSILVRSSLALASTSLDPSAGEDAAFPAQGPAVEANLTLGPEELERLGRVFADARRYLDGSVVEYLQGRLARCKMDDGKLGPGKALPTVLGLLGVIQQYIREVKPEVRQGLLLVGADCAEFAGWLHRDTGSYLVASYWQDRAIEWAKEAGDLPMQGYILLRKSQTAYDNRDASLALALAQAAGGEVWSLPAKVQVEVLLQEARGMAMHGASLRTVEQKLDEAHRLFANASDRGGGLLQLGLGFNNCTLMLRTASCYVEAGRPAEAAKLYETALGQETLSRRDEGYFRARWAGALALSGEPDIAAKEGLVALQLAELTNSHRTKRELLRVASSLGPWRGRLGPRTLRNLLETSSSSSSARP